MAVGKSQREKHFRLMQQKQYKKAIPPGGGTDEYWIEQAKLPLFRGKRAIESRD